MKKILLLFLLISFSFFINAQGLSGNYTIDPSLPNGKGNYQSFSMLADDLNNLGVSAAVYVEVEAGTYLDSLYLHHIPGSSPNNTITIDGQDSSLTVLSYAFAHSFQIPKGTVVLDSTQYLLIKNLSIENTDSSSGVAVYLLNGASNIRISNSVFTVDPKNKSDVNLGYFTNLEIRAKDTAINCNYNTFSHNRISGGRTGILITGYSLQEKAVKNSILYNEITEIDRAIYASLQDSLDVIGNIIQVQPYFYQSLYAVSLGSYSNLCVKNNFINAERGGIDINTSSIDTNSKNTIKICNNMIISKETGLRISSHKNTKTLIYHNSILTDTSGYQEHFISAINFYYSYMPGKYDLRNNILSSSGFAIEIAGNIDSVFSHFNNNIYYTTGPYLFFFRSPKIKLYPNLSTFKRDYPQFNSTSWEVDPQYISAKNLHLKTSFAYGNADKSVGINEDIDGDARPLPASNNISIGADEFQPYNLNASILKLNNHPICSNSFQPSVQLANWGMDTLHSLKILYSINGTKDSVQLNQSIPPSDTLNVTLNTISISPANVNHFLAYTQLPNGLSDDHVFDDTLSQIIQMGLSGNYSIDSSQSTSARNFQSFEDLAKYLHEYGMCGPSIVNVTSGSGPYNNQMVLKDLKGSSAVNTLTINGNGETIKHRSTEDGEVGCITLENSTYIKIDSLSIEIDNAMKHNGHGIYIKDNCHHITINNCNISLDSNGVGNPTGGILVANEEPTTYYPIRGNAHSITLSNNSITSITDIAMFGIRFSYEASVFPFAPLSSNNRIINNFISNISHGIYAVNHDSLLIQANNIDLPPSGFYSSVAGIDFTGNNSIIDRNIVHDGVIKAGISVKGKENLISNNLISKINNLRSHYVGIASTGANLIYNNSVYFNDSNRYASRIIGIATDTSSSNFINNLISIKNYGKATAIGLSIGDFNSPFNCISNYNNIYLVPSNALNYYGAHPIPWPGTFQGYSSLSAWQNKTAQDMNSLSVDPKFLNVLSNDFTPQATALHGSGMFLSQITEDLYGNPRGNKIDIGAIEYGSTVEIMEKIDMSNYQLFPNPSSGIFYLLQSKEIKANYRLSLMDMNGKLLFEKEMNSSGYQLEKLDFSGFPKGMYFLKVITDQGESIEKLVIK